MTRLPRFCLLEWIPYCLTLRKRWERDSTEFASVRGRPEVRLTVYLMKRQSAPPMTSGIRASARSRSHCVASRLPDSTKACDSRQRACTQSGLNYSFIRHAAAPQHLRLVSSYFISASAHIVLQEVPEIAPLRGVAVFDPPNIHAHTEQRNESKNAVWQKQDPIRHAGTRERRCRPSERAPAPSKQPPGRTADPASRIQGP